jgi:opacity protein-like surface antigen
MIFLKEFHATNWLQFCKKLKIECYSKKKLFNKLKTGTARKSINLVTVLKYLVGCFFCITCFAKSVPFKGFYLSAGGGGSLTYYHAVWSQNNQNPVFDNLNLHLNNSAFLGQISLGYTRPLPSKFNITSDVNWLYRVGGNEKVITWPNTVPIGVNAIYKASNFWSVSLRPGYSLSQTSLIYGILALAREKFSYINPPFYTAQFTYNGVGYGIGLKQIVMSHISIGLELERIQFGAKLLPPTANGAGAPPTITPTINIGLVNINYYFG